MIWFWHRALLSSLLFVIRLQLPSLAHSAEFETVKPTFSEEPLPAQQFLVINVDLFFFFGGRRVSRVLFEKLVELLNSSINNVLCFYSETYRAEGL